MRPLFFDRLPIRIWMYFSPPGCGAVRCSSKLPAIQIPEDPILQMKVTMMDLSKISRTCTPSDIVACLLLVTLVVGVSMPSSVRVVNGGKPSTGVRVPVAAVRSPISERAGVADRSSHPFNPIASKSADALKHGKPAAHTHGEGRGQSSGRDARLD